MVNGRRRRDLADDCACPLINCRPALRRIKLPLCHNDRLSLQFDLVSSLFLPAANACSQILDARLMLWYCGEVSGL